MAYDLALEAASEDKWKQLAELATSKSEFSLAQECLHRAQDFGKSWIKSIYRAVGTTSGGQGLKLGGKEK